MSESWYYIDGESNTFQVSSTSERNLLGYGGLGVPPIQHIVQPIPYEHGAEHLGYRYQPRVFNLVVLDVAASRDAMWQHLQDWAQAFNLDRGLGQLKVVLSDGTERRLWCYLNSGLEGNSEDRPTRVMQRDVIQLIAVDPFWFDPSQKSASDNFNGVTPVDIACTVSGDVPCWPTLQLDSAVENPTIELVGTGEQIVLTYNLSANHIDIDCAEPTILYNDVTNILQYVSKASVFFDLQRGSNTVRLTAAAGSAGLCTVRWYDRYLNLGAA